MSVKRSDPRKDHMPAHGGVLNESRAAHRLKSALCSSVCWDSVPTHGYSRGTVVLISVRGGGGSGSGRVQAIPLAYLTPQPRCMSRAS